MTGTLEVSTDKTRDWPAWVADVEPWRLLAFMAETYEDQYVVDTTDLEASVFEGPEVVGTIDPEELVARLDALVEERAR